jgi:predicted SnoaL-like aldol condensation-catalyzing enzyme
MKTYSNSLDQDAQHTEQATNGIKKSSLSDASENIVKRHLNSFLNNKLEVLMSDYTNESVLITQEGTYSGLEEIRHFFVGLSMHFPKQKSSIELDSLVAHNDLVYIVWHAKTPTLDVPIGSDTFIIKEGKIYRQTFAGQLNFIN